MLAPGGRGQVAVRSVGDVWKYRFELKRCGYNGQLLFRCATLVHEAYQRKLRFRTYECLRVLRAQVIAAGNRPIAARTTRVLFEIYRGQIFTCNEKLQWILSRLIKGQHLDNSAIGWLLENWGRSNHVANRLLLYPGNNVQIAAWARSRLADGKLSERTSELVAILIPQAGSKVFESIPPVVAAWGVSKARISLRAKETALLGLIENLDAEIIVQIAERLSSHKLIRAALSQRRAMIG
jgi:hypothetical protein